MSLNLESLKAEISQLKLTERAILAKHINSTFAKEPALTVLQIAHPYITCHKDYCGGCPVIAGTKFPVHSVVNYVLKQGLTPEELVKEFKHLNLSQVYDALSYYYAHPAEVELELLENCESQLKDEWHR
jgi:uncharacterized protein (DUF433 family)